MAIIRSACVSVAEIRTRNLFTDCCFRDKNFLEPETKKFWECFCKVLAIVWRA